MQHYRTWTTSASCTSRSPLLLPVAVRYHQDLVCEVPRLCGSTGKTWCIKFISMSISDMDWFRILIRWSTLNHSMSAINEQTMVFLCIGTKMVH